MHAGYGGTVTLPTADHIDVCKPLSREDPAYATLFEMLAEVHARTAPQHVAPEEVLDDPPED